jgi:hypothetical protein
MMAQSAGAAGQQGRQQGRQRSRQGPCCYAAGSRVTASVPASKAAVAAAAVVALVLLGLLAAPAAAGRAMLQSEGSGLRLLLALLACQHGLPGQQLLN